jgi:hypothetical protein
LEKIRVTAVLKQKIPFLRFLPEYCEIIFIELNMKKIVHADILNLFKNEFDIRIKKRKDKEKILKKELKIEYDEM